MADDMEKKGQHGSQGGQSQQGDPSGQQKQGHQGSQNQPQYQPKKGGQGQDEGKAEDQNSDRQRRAS